MLPRRNLASQLDVHRFQCNKSMLISAPQNPFVRRGTPGRAGANRAMEPRASPPAYPARHERARRLSPALGLCARQNCPMLETVADPDGGCAPRIEVGDSSRKLFSSTLNDATPDCQILAAGSVCGDARAVGSGSIGALPARTLCADAAGCAGAKYAFLPSPRGSRGSRTISLRPHQQK